MDKHRLKKYQLNQFQIIMIGFAALIVCGAFLLMLPCASASGQVTPFNQALFTATSASCVTGLILQDTGTYWSVFGQIVIILLIQIGGLGIVSMVSLVALISGKKLSLRERETLQDAISAPQVGGIVRRLRFIVKVTLITEAVGFIIMLPVFCSDFGAEGIWMALFHAISAFCNAGFDLMGSKSGAFTSLTAYHDNGIITSAISLLIILGGIGFFTWEDFVKHRLKFRRYKMQSKVILLTTAVLIILPAALYFFNDFSELAFGDCICQSIFQAVTPRTAGFNTADLNGMTSNGRILMIILMLIGGSPGSTAGGMKTTTLAVLFANIAAVFRNRKDVNFFGRRIADQVIKNAAVILTLYLILCLGGAMVISAAEGLPFTTCVFETASAVGTVGLTLGITPSLGFESQMILILLMYLGRVGGMTMLLSAANPKERIPSQYPHENLIVG